jgi:hypothetical protein
MCREPTPQSVGSQLLRRSSDRVDGEREEEPTVPDLSDVRQQLLKLVVADEWDRGVDMFSGRNVADCK